MNYDDYNREERYTCSHLFRLLHEPASEYRALSEFMKRPISNRTFRIYSEVALIRDAYHARKPLTHVFMDKLTQLLMKQEEVSDCRLYSQLPVELSNGSKTHPKDIRQKAGDSLSQTETRVYGAMQGMFNAKPDLAICVGSDLVIYEAKLTLDFDRDQMRRTRNIGEVWAKLLFSDLGFSLEPNVHILTLGLQRFSPDVSWETISKIAEIAYPPDDRTRVALARASCLGLGEK